MFSRKILAIRLKIYLLSVPTTYLCNSVLKNSNLLPTSSVCYKSCDSKYRIIIALLFIYYCNKLSIPK